MKFLFCGDISPTVDTAAAFESGDVQALFGDTAQLFYDADVSIVNLECALADADSPIPKIGPALRAPTATAQTLAKLGVSYCALANNHVFDHGKAGIESTLKALEDAGIGYTGFGEDEVGSNRDLILEGSGETVCIMAVCEHEYSYALPDRMGARAFDEFETPLQVREAKEKFDRVVVLYHGGKEQCRYPSPRLRKACHAMAKSGADVILCQHSHCVGCYEQLDGCHILYGQGNFHFVKESCRKMPGWFDCLAVRYDSKTNAMDFVPVEVKTAVGIGFAEGEAKEQLLADFAARNRALVDGTWLAGWREFCESKREDYTRIARLAFTDTEDPKAPERFAHYLDCEAHLDVWKELFQTYNKTNEK